MEYTLTITNTSDGTVSTIVCNWFGAGNAGLADPNNDSSIQSYANIYDQNWLMKGNAMIAPGVERVDTVKTDSGYEMKSIWTRNDLSDTAIMKLSTATGYIYGYVQDLTTGMWQYIILDLKPARLSLRWMFPTSTATIIWPSACTPATAEMHSTAPPAIWSCFACRTALSTCPNFRTARSISIRRHEMCLHRISLHRTAAKVRLQAGAIPQPSAMFTQHHGAFRMNNLSGSASDLTLYAYGADGKLVKVAPELWSITDETGAAASELTDGVSMSCA